MCGSVAISMVVSQSCRWYCCSESIMWFQVLTPEVFLGGTDGCWSGREIWCRSIMTVMVLCSVMAEQIPSLWGHLSLLVRANSKESIEYILQAIYQTRHTGLDTADRQIFRIILQLPNDSNIDPIALFYVTVLAGLLHRCPVSFSQRVPNLIGGRFVNSQSSMSIDVLNPKSNAMHWYSVLIVEIGLTILLWK